MPKDLEEIRELIKSLPSPEEDGGKSVQEELLAHYGQEASPLIDAASWIATWRGRRGIALQHPRVALFAGTYGHLSHQHIQTHVQSIVNRTSLLNPVCTAVDVDLRLYELDLDNPTADFTQGPAMTDSDCARAMAYGMMAVEAGVDILILGELEAGQESPLRALMAVIQKNPDLACHDPVAQKALDTQGLTNDPLEALRRFGGYDIAAMAGAILAACMGRVPVLLGTQASLVAAHVLAALSPSSVAHCRTAQPGYCLGKVVEEAHSSDILSSILTVSFLKTVGRVCSF